MGKLEFLKLMLSPGSDNPATCFCTVKKRAIFQCYLFPLAWLVLLCRTSPGILRKSKAMHKTKALQSTFLPWSSLEKALYLNWSCTGPEHPLCNSRKPDITHRHACREDLWAALQMLPYEGRCCKLKVLENSLFLFWVFLILNLIMKSPFLYSGKPGKWSLDFTVILIAG